MKKFIENFYIISKLGLSLTLMVCLIGTLYVIYINYQKEDKISEKQIIFSENLQKNINKNSELINKIVTEIKTNEVTLLDIKNNLESIKKFNKDEDISKLSESIKLLNKNFDLLSNEIQSLKNINTSSVSDKNLSALKNVDINKDEIIDLILFKYENNMNLNKELEYLDKFTEQNKKTHLEKISILLSSPFKGYDYLSTTFEEEVNIYLKKLINKKPESFFSKIILPYLDVSPSTENIITNDLIIKIKKVKINIENRNIKNSLINLKTIKDYEKSFKLSTIEIKKYLDFKNEISNLK